MTDREWDLIIFVFLQLGPQKTWQIDTRVHLMLTFDYLTAKSYDSCMVALKWSDPNEMKHWL